MAPPQSVGEAARAILLTADPRAKVMLARAVARGWRAGRIAHVFPVTMPDTPARGDRPVLLPPTRMPRRGRAGSARTRIAMLHAVAHIEYGAIDLAADIIGRFGGQFPRAFIDDWMGVLAEEAMHFALVDRRLRTLGAAYGDLPAHDGLWEAAEATADDALARLAVVPMVLEARGLDVTPAMATRFAGAGDEKSAAILWRILADEIGHVGVGVRWFQHLCAVQRFDAVARWRAVVGARFGGAIKPPFNDSARRSAGLTQDFYDGVAPAGCVSHKTAASSG